MQLYECLMQSSDNDSDESDRNVTDRRGGLRLRLGLGAIPSFETERKLLTVVAVKGTQRMR